MVSSTLQTELLDKLSTDIDSGSIKVLQDAPIFDKIEEVFGSEWPYVDGVITKGSPEELNNIDSKIQTTNRLFDEQGVSCTKQVFVVSDSDLEIGLQCEWQAFIGNLRHFLNLPQHLYVIACDYSWCLLFSMEGFIEFGRRPKQHK